MLRTGQMSGTDIHRGGGVNFEKMRGVGHLVFYDMLHNINIFTKLLKMTGRFQENGRSTTFLDLSIDMPVAPALRRLLVDVRNNYSSSLIVLCYLCSWYTTNCVYVAKFSYVFFSAVQLPQILYCKDDVFVRHLLWFLPHGNYTAVMVRRPSVRRVHCSKKTKAISAGILILYEWLIHLYKTTGQR